MSTLVVPHDLAWERSSRSTPSGPAASAPAEGLPDAAARFTRECAAALKSCPRGKAALYVGGRAALADRES